MSEGTISPLIVKYEKSLADDARSRSFAPLAEAYRKVGLIDKAFDVLKKGLRYNPDYLLGYLTLAQCYSDKGEYNLAYTTIKPLIAPNRDNLKLQNLFADCAERTNHLEEALDSYKYLLFLNPKDQNIANKVNKLEQELHEEVVSVSQEAIKFDLDDLKASPSDDQAIDDWEQVSFSQESETAEASEEDEWKIGVDFDEEKRASKPKEEARSLRELIEDKKSEPQEEENLLPLTKKQDNFDEERASPVVTHTLVDIYIKQGHYAKAKEILEKIIEISPENGENLKKLQAIEAQLSGLEDVAVESKSKSKDFKKEDEGRDNLMAAFDRTFGEDEASETEQEEPDDNKRLCAQEVEIVLKDFLSELDERSQRI